MSRLTITDDQGFSTFAGLTAVIAAVLIIVYRNIFPGLIDTGNEENFALAHVAAYEAGTEWASRLSHAIAGISSLLLVALVIALAAFASNLHQHWVRWLTGIGAAGLILHGYYHLRATLEEPTLVDAYLGGDDVVRASVVANWTHVYADPSGLMSGTLLVIWLAAINGLAWKFQFWSRWLAGFGLAVAILIILRELTGGLVPAILTHGGLLPVWYALMGLALMGMAPSPLRMRNVPEQSN